jgi:hypothetical protein
MLAAGRQFVLRATPVLWGVSRFLGQTGRQMGGCSADGSEVVVDLAGDVALEHPDDLFLDRPSFVRRST